MFTGLIEAVGVVAEVTRGRGLRLAVQAPGLLQDLKPGDSIAVSGPCLTVERLEGNRFYASLLPETEEVSTLGEAQAGLRVNLERPLRAGDGLGGHLVTGHIDGVAEVTAVRDRGETRLVELLCPPGVEHYLVERGSVALDGVSLTVRAPQGRRFSVALVAATLAATTLGELRPGDRVNLEADILAKHLERLLAPREGKDASQELLAWLGETELSP
jgi:riboflavin synthase